MGQNAAFQQRLERSEVGSGENGGVDAGSFSDLSVSEHAETTWNECAVAVLHNHRVFISIRCALSRGSSLQCGGSRPLICQQSWPFEQS